MYSITPGDSSLVEVVGHEKRFRHTVVIITPRSSSEAHASLRSPDCVRSRAYAGSIVVRVMLGAPDWWRCA